GAIGGRVREAIATSSIPTLPAKQAHLILLIRSPESEFVHEHPSRIMRTSLIPDVSPENRASASAPIQDEIPRG
ncbi:MAG: hypothetical protein ACXVB5_14355, partial [Isosphaeraceae bacterium]